MISPRISLYNQTSIGAQKGRGSRGRVDFIQETTTVILIENTCSLISIQPVKLFDQHKPVLYSDQWMSRREGGGGLTSPKDVSDEAEHP